MTYELVINDTELHSTLEAREPTPILGYDDELQLLLSKMSNYQRTQYTRIKRAGLDIPIGIVRKLATLPHHSAEGGSPFVWEKPKRFRQRYMKGSPNYVSKSIA